MQSAPDRVLVVDDEPDICTALQDLFELCLPDIEVLIAHGGPEALETLQAHGDVGLIMTDYRMPGMDGITFLGEARLLAPAAHRIMMTAFPDMDVAIRAINDGRIVHFLAKPLRMEEVVQLVAGELAERRALIAKQRAIAAGLHAWRGHHEGKADVTASQ